MIAFWEHVHGHLSAGSRVFVACVAEHTRGSPGTAGAKLLVTDAGELFGTIGGGAMEHRLVEQAKGLLQGGDRRPRMQSQIHSESAGANASGMVCEGSQTNVFCMLDGHDLGNVATIIDNTIQDRDAGIFIDENGLHLMDAPPGAVAPGITLTDAEKAWQYRETLLNRRRLTVIGGGHCAGALGETMAPLGYRVEVFDTRSGVVSHERANAVGSVSIVADYADVGRTASHPEWTAVVVMTADYRTDVRALLGVLGLPFPFVGLMGGRKKIERIFSLLRDEGISAQTIERIHAPVGLDIGSETPEEIAISIAAQILRERNRR